MSSHSTLGCTAALLLVLGGCVPGQHPVLPVSAAERPTAPARMPRGSLVIVGGGPRVESVMRRFVELAGGPARARIVVFPMASELPETGAEAVAELRKLGVTALARRLTRDEAMVPSSALVLDSATGIWFPGGDQVRLAQVLVGTPVADAIRARFDAGAVIGGTSAGAAVMSTPMITGDERAPGGARRDTTQSFLTIARGDIVLGEGLGLVRDAIVDQHFLRRKRHNRLISVVLEDAPHLAAGIDESTALVVQPDGKWRVSGESVVIIYDARQATISPTGSGALGATDLRMHVLPAGATFDPKTGVARLGGAR